MPADSHRRAAPLSVVPERSHAVDAEGKAPPAHQQREIDWSILMARAQSGDAAAYRRLLVEIAPYLRALAVRHHRDPSDVEDTVQDVLLTVHAIRHTYDPSRPFGPWLTAIARRRIVDRLRRQARSVRQMPLDPEGAFAAPDTNWEEAACDRHAVRDAVERLSPAQRQAIRLLKLEELSLQEAASVSGMSVASLKVATHRALKNLRRWLRTPA